MGAFVGLILGGLMFVLALAAFWIGVGFVRTEVGILHGSDRDCSDFATHAKAQEYYMQQDGDPDHLDADRDGIACERNP